MDQNQSAFERFLVEDVILTLGNPRGSMAWVVQSETTDANNRQRAWMERIDRQIESLEERARHLIAHMRTSASFKHRAPASDRICAVSGERQIATMKVMAGQATRQESNPVFRSSRAAYP